MLEKRCGAWLPVLLLVLPAAAAAQEHGAHAQHRMSMDANGMTMNQNTDLLPRDCDRVRGEHAIEVRAGHRYAKDLPGAMFGFSANEWVVGACSQVTVTLVNEDEVRHQWMVHGLPRYLYPGGMFHLEASGGQSRSGSFIVPSDHRTYLVHCDLTQHMEKGMKAQLKVGRGSGDLWSVPGRTGDLEHARAASHAGWRAPVLAFFIVFVFSLLTWRWLRPPEQKV